MSRGSRRAQEPGPLMRLLRKLASVRLGYEGPAASTPPVRYEHQGTPGPGTSQALE